MPRTERSSPSELTEVWPAMPSRDYAGEQAPLFVLNSQSAMGTQSQRAVARAAHLDEGTLRRVLAGATWPDLRTIALLEDALGVPCSPSTSEGATVAQKSVVSRPASAR